MQDRTIRPSTANGSIRRHRPVTAIPISAWSPTGAPSPTPTKALQQSQALEAGMPGAADHEMVVQGDADRRGGTLDLARHGDVGLRGRRIARRMVVQDATGMIYHIELQSYI